MTKLKKNLIIQTELQFQFNLSYIKSNQIIEQLKKFEFLNFKWPNFFKFQIDFETYSAFVVIVKSGYYICQISNFLKFNCLNLHNQKVKVSKRLQFCTVSECLTI